MKKCFLVTMAILWLSACAGRGSLFVRPGWAVGDLNSDSHTIALPAQAKHIALLLPISGPLAAQGAAVRDGFLAAYRQAEVEGIKPREISVRDTNKHDIRKLYRRTTREGAEIVVGPLTKKRLRKLSSGLTVNVPTLALNQIGIVRSKRLYQFGLSPEEEAAQVAQWALQSRHLHSLVIRPDKPWGRRIAEAFKKQLERLGGQVVDELTYRASTPLNQSIQTFLEVDQSQRRAKVLQGVLREHLRSVPKRRQDADMIFLVATPSKARQIKPLLNYYYAVDLPVYSTSIVFSGHINTNKDLDLNGIRFVDMPWTVSSDAQLSQALAQLRRGVVEQQVLSARKYPRLFALGMDAYRLVTLSPANQISGATGMLWADSHRWIHRRLMAARMSHGVPKVKYGQL